MCQILSEQKQFHDQINFNFTIYLPIMVKIWLVSVELSGDKQTGPTVCENSMLSFNTMTAKSCVRDSGNSGRT